MMAPGTWAVHYRVPLTRHGDRWPKYRCVQVDFKSKESAELFFNENVRSQSWFDSETCYIEGS